MYKVGLTGGIGTGKSYIGKLFSVYGVKIIDSDVIARVVVLPGSPTLKEIAAHFGAEVIEADGSLNRRALRERVFAQESELAALNAIIHPAIHQLINEYCDLVATHQPLPEVYYLTAALQQANAQEARRLKAKTKPQETLSREERQSRKEHFLQTQELINTPLDPSVVFSEEHPAPYVILDIPLLFENGWDQVVDSILVVDCEPELQISRVMKRDGATKEQALAIISRQCPRDFKLEHADEVISTDSPCVADKRQAVLNLHLKYLAQARAAAPVETLP